MRSSSRRPWVLPQRLILLPSPNAIQQAKNINWIGYMITGPAESGISAQGSWIVPDVNCTTTGVGGPDEFFVALTKQCST